MINASIIQDDYVVMRARCLFHLKGRGILTPKSLHGGLFVTSAEIARSLIERKVAKLAGHKKRSLLLKATPAPASIVDPASF